MPLVLFLSLWPWSPRLLVSVVFDKSCFAVVASATIIADTVQDQLVHLQMRSPGVKNVTLSQGFYKPSPDGSYTDIHIGY